MTGGPVTFALVPAPGQDPSPVAGLAPVPVPGSHRAYSVCWLDTFDRRLSGRGIELALERPAGGHWQWTLRPPGAPPVRERLIGDGPPAASPGGTGGPGLAGAGPGPVVRVEDLPASLSAVVRGPSSGRALLRLATAEVTEDTLALLDQRDKTVCRIGRRRLVNGSHRLELLSLLPLRGYEQEAAAAAARLADVPGVLPVEDGGLQAWLDQVGAGPAPGSYPAAAGLGPDIPADRALATIVARLADTVELNRPGTLARYDTEFLHDLRVAVRRSRTAVKLARGVVPEPHRQGLAEELRWLGQVTTPARDFDVYLEGWHEMVGRVSAELQADLAPFHGLLVEQTEEAHRGLQEALGTPRYREVVEAARGLPREVEAAATGGDGGVEAGAGTFARFVAERLRVTVGAVVKRCRRVEAAPGDDEAVHDLRKRAKELRYLLEFGAGVIEPDAGGRLLRDLKDLQDVLGAYNDSVVQAAYLLDAAGRLASAPPRTLVAVGELRGAILTAGRRARRDLPGRMEGLERWAGATARLVTAGAGEGAGR